jgi:hypothetical protein
MALRQIFQNLEKRFQRRLTADASPRLLSQAQRQALQQDVARMEAVVSVQQHDGFVALEAAAAELADGVLRGLAAMNPVRFRGPTGIEEKGRVLGLEQGRPSKLVAIVIERGTVAARLLHEDNRARQLLARSPRAIRV